jgi:two-component system cell cycle response regulator DivK
MKKKILVVEDNDLNLKLFQDLLEAHNMEVVSTKDGREGFSLACTEKPDLILMDIQLRGISGLDIIRKIKSEKNTRAIPVIAVTAYAMKDDEEKILQSGCEAYIAKPISIGHFIEVVSRFLNVPQDAKA